MKKLIVIIALLFASLPALAQNWATVSANNITDLNQQKLPAGQICFLATDQSDTPISFQAGGGGQVLKRAFCSAVNAGVATAFTVPNPALASPSGIYYRVTVRDSSTGQEVLRYPGVTFSGGTFNFDSYTPVLSGASLAPLTGTSVSGNLGVTGNVSATGTITGSNIPASIAGAGSCAGQHVSVLNASAGPTCSANYTNVVTITGSTGLAASGTGGQMAGGFPSPSIRRDYIGDGTGWRMEWAKRSASTDTLEAWITDGGVFNAAGGFQFNGGAPSGNVLRGTGTSFVASQLNFSDLAGAAAITQGGTGQTTAAAAFNALAPMTTLGDIVYESAANTASRLAGNTATTKKYLSQTGTGAASAAPAWAQIAAADLSDGNTGTGAIVHASSPALTSPTITGTAPIGRLRANQGTAISSSDFALSSGWGTTAVISSVRGTDSAGAITVTPNGTGLAVNPFITFTFHDGTWTTTPICGVSAGDGNTTTSRFPSSISATQLTLFFAGSPVAGTPYTFYFICMGI